MNDIWIYIKDVLHSLSKLVENHPALSSGFFTILGAVLSIIFDLKKKVETQTTKIKSRIKTRNFTFIFGSNNNVSQASSHGEIARQQPAVVSATDYNGPLSNTQREICRRVKSLSIKYSSQIDIEASFDDSIRTLNSNEVNLAAGKFVQLFNIVSSGLTVIAQSNNAIDELNQLVTLTNGLHGLIGTSTDQDSFKRQISSCESMLWKLLVKLPI